MTTITTIEDLEALYDTPNPASTVKEASALTPQYRALIEASPFCALATCGPEGLDCSPRGESPSVVTIEDDRTLMMPDRRGNNRLDSLRNIIRDPRIALLFLIPGSGITMRVHGRAVLSADAALLERFAVDGKPPRSVIVIRIETVYFQCARAVVRSGVWAAPDEAALASLPTPGQILAEMSGGTEGGPDYDADWPERAQKTLW